MECEALRVLVQASFSVLTKSLVGPISCPGLQSEHSNYSLEPPSCFSSQYPLCMKYCYLPFPTLLLTDCALNTVLTLLTVYHLVQQENITACQFKFHHHLLFGPFPAKNCPPIKKTIQSIFCLPTVIYSTPILVSFLVSSLMPHPELVYASTLAGQVGMF